MLRECAAKAKFVLLKQRLGSHYRAVGALESLWHFTAANTPRGDVGRFPDDQIEALLEWDGEAGELVAALLDTGWLDRVPDDLGRLYTHDWDQHADDATQRKLARRRAFFANGAAPKLHSLPRAERESLTKWYSENTREPLASDSQGLASPTRAPHEETPFRLQGQGQGQGQGRGADAPPPTTAVEEESPENAAEPSSGAGPPGKRCRKSSNSEAETSKPGPMLIAGHQFSRRRLEQLHALVPALLRRSTSIGDLVAWLELMVPRMRARGRKDLARTAVNWIQGAADRGTLAQEIERARREAQHEQVARHADRVEAEQQTGPEDLEDPAADIDFEALDIASVGARGSP